MWGQKVKVREGELSRDQITAVNVQSEQEETQRREGWMEKSKETENTKGSEEEGNWGRGFSKGYQNGWK